MQHLAQPLESDFVDTGNALKPGPLTEQNMTHSDQD